jgi:hypothetical protein
MMERFFADTSFFVAYHNSRDANYLRARTLVQGFQGHPVLLIATDYIFTEVLTVLLVRSNKDMAIQVGKIMMADPNIEILPITRELFNEAWEVFQGFRDKEWSFTDCTSYVLMRELNIDTGISFDRHFSQFGVQVIP